MLTYTSGTIGLAAASLTAYRYCRKHRIACQCIDDVHTIEDIVHWLHALADETPTTDGMSEAIVEHVCLHGINESTVKRISRLHVQYGADDGAAGYAINVMWSAILHAIASTTRSVIIVDE